MKPFHFYSPEFFDLVGSRAFIGGLIALALGGFVLVNIIRSLIPKRVKTNVPVAVPFAAIGTPPGGKLSPETFRQILLDSVEVAEFDPDDCDALILDCLQDIAAIKFTVLLADHEVTPDTTINELIGLLYDKYLLRG